MRKAAKSLQPTAPTNQYRCGDARLCRTLLVDLVEQYVSCGARDAVCVRRRHPGIIETHPSPRPVGSAAGRVHVCDVVARVQTAVVVGHADEVVQRRRRACGQRCGTSRRRGPGVATHIGTEIQAGEREVHVCEQLLAARAVVFEPLDVYYLPGGKTKTECH